MVVTGRLLSRSWTDKDGQTRYVTEVEADEVAPSLRWATATVTRADRKPEAAGVDPRALPDEDSPF